MSTPLFRGPDSLRTGGERVRLVAVLLTLPLTLAIIGFFFENAVTVHGLLLVLIGAMLFVAVSRGRFLGGGVRLGPEQFGEVHAIVAECAAMLGVAMPHVFLRDDPFVPIVAIGTGDPYALVFSAQYIEVFTPDELRFLVGRELGHVAAGHAKLTSLLSANGRENAVVAVAFGPWLRTTEYTADRVGLLCCGSVDAAFSAIATSTFHHVGRKIDLHAFAEQRRELDAEPSLRIGELLGATPFATNRIAKLASFAHEPLCARWRERLAAAGISSGAVTLAPEDPRRFAGPWRRAGALFIDYLIISAAIPSSGSEHAKEVDAAVNDSSIHGAAATVVREALGSHAALTFSVGSGIVTAAFLAYVVVLVAFAGQTIGMMICDLRVVGARRDRIGIRGAIARYACFIASIPALVGIVSLLRRVQPYERWSGTRLVNGNAARP